MFESFKKGLNCLVWEQRKYFNLTVWTYINYWKTDGATERDDAHIFFAKNEVWGRKTKSINEFISSSIG